ncbi:MAG: tRNA 2-thiouridine(34) synthase MnmA, partial [Chloroflexi bacterium]|nr:tRNA 2-thiouridine(34) synthase MnmA [Chloroflexota bacterium]
CCSLDDIEDARRVCQALDIPFYTLNMEDDFRRLVIDYFAGEYARGRTPNPCLACNAEMKFRLLLGKAIGLGARYLATGHYARIAQRDDVYRLLKARDGGKDQSYVLYMLGQAELARLLFPVGELPKEEVRRLAAERGLPVATKPDSQEICFVTAGDYRRFLADRAPSSGGEIIDSSGRSLGRHQGIAGYTVGQRRGLGLAKGEPMYVLAVDAQSNTITVGPEEALWRRDLLAERLSFVSGVAPQECIEVAAKIRYRTREAPALLEVQGEGARVIFTEPQRAITPGQAVVFYAGDEVLGGGIIAG